LSKSVPLGDVGGLDKLDQRSWVGWLSLSKSGPWATWVVSTSSTSGRVSV